MLTSSTPNTTWNGFPSLIPFVRRSSPCQNLQLRTKTGSEQMCHFGLSLKDTNSASWHLVPLSASQFPQAKAASSQNATCSTSMSFEMISGIFYDVQLAQFLEILLMALECLDFHATVKVFYSLHPKHLYTLAYRLLMTVCRLSDQSTSQCFPNCLKPGSATGLNTCLFHCCCSMFLPGSPFSFSSKVESDSLDVLCLRSLEETRSALRSQSFSMCDNPIAFRGAIARSRNCPESWELKATAATCPARSGRFGEGFSNPQILMRIEFIYSILIHFDPVCLAQDEKEKHDDEVDTKTRLDARIRVFHSKGPETDP